MKRLVRLRAVAALTLGLALSTLAVTTTQAQTPVKFTLDWRFEGPAAPFTVALDKGYFKAEGLDVTIDTGSGSRESIPRVASGTYDIGAGDVNSLIRFRDENPTIDLKAVMMVYDRPPFAIVGRKSKGITADPNSLAGKKFGAPAADGAYAQWPIFRSVNKLDDKGMKFENLGFPVREPMLASGDERLWSGALRQRADGEPKVRRRETGSDQGFHQGADQGSTRHPGGPGCGDDDRHQAQ